MRLGFPSIFTTGITFPKDQVLSSTQRSIMSAYGIHLVFPLSFDEFTRLRDVIWAKLGGLSLWREEGSMEDFVHLLG